MSSIDEFRWFALSLLETGAITITDDGVLRLAGTDIPVIERVKGVGRVVPLEPWLGGWGLEDVGPHGSRRSKGVDALRNNIDNIVRPSLQEAVLADLPTHWIADWDDVTLTSGLDAVANNALARNRNLRAGRGSQGNTTPIQKHEMHNNMGFRVLSFARTMLVTPEEPKVAVLDPYAGWEGETIETDRHLTEFVRRWMIACEQQNRVGPMGFSWRGAFA